MTIQENYSDRQDEGRAGDVANTEISNLISRTVETEDGIEFAKVVERGALDNTCKAFAGGKPLGIVARQRSMDAQSPNKFKQNSEARICTVGVIRVNAAVAVNQGDQVYVVNADGTLSNVDTDATEYPNAVWDSSTTEAGLASIALNVR